MVTLIFRPKIGKTDRLIDETSSSVSINIEDSNEKRQLKKCALSVEKMTSATCAASIEKSISKLKGTTKGGPKRVDSG